MPVRELPRGVTRSRARVPEVVRDLRVRVDRRQVQYLDAGCGPTLLLIHGHEQSATTWRWVMPALARTHRVLAVSLTGHDGTDDVGGYAPGDDLVPFVAAFLDALGLDPVDVVGHSAGGAVALRLALAQPHRVRTLTLVDSAGLGRHVHPLLALDTQPGLGELAIMLSRLPGGALTRSLMSVSMLFARPWRAPLDFTPPADLAPGEPGPIAGAGQDRGRGADGSPGSRAALRWALREASARGLALHVVTAWEGQ